MTTFLLDVNVLVGLMLPGHSSHDVARSWFLAEGRQSWLTCPLTQNGAVRICSLPQTTGRNIQVSQATSTLHQLLASGNHQFIADSVSLLDPDAFDSELIRSPKQITGTYLLGLAAHHRAVLATFDRKLTSDSVRNPRAKVLLL